MLTARHVLIMTQNHTLRNLLEQVFMIRDIQIVIAATVQGAEAIVELWGLQRFGLVLIDTAALGEDEAEQQDVVCRLFKTWAEKCPCLPYLLLGTLLQKYAVHKIREVRFLVKPYRLDELVAAIDEFYPGTHDPDVPLSHPGVQGARRET